MKPGAVRCAEKRWSIANANAPGAGNLSGRKANQAGSIMFVARS
jgi:hypothetical protein